MAKLLSKAAILAAEDLPTEVVDVPEWGGSVRVRGLTGRARDAFEAEVQQIEGNVVVGVDRTNFRARFLVHCLVDESGVQLFDQSEVEALGEKSGGAIDRVFDVAQRLSGMSTTSAKEMEENFGKGQSDDSTSG